jgi:hypothetical protein
MPVALKTPYLLFLGAVPSVGYAKTAMGICLLATRVVPWPVATAGLHCTDPIRDGGEGGVEAMERTSPSKDQDSCANAVVNQRSLSGWDE